MRIGFGKVLTGCGNWRYGRKLLIDDYGGYPNWRYTGTDEGASERATLGAEAIEGRLQEMHYACDILYLWFI